MTLLKPSNRRRNFERAPDSVDAMPTEELNLYAHDDIFHHNGTPAQCSARHSARAFEPLLCPALRLRNHTIAFSLMADWHAPRVSLSPRLNTRAALADSQGAPRCWLHRALVCTGEMVGPLVRLLRPVEERLTAYVRQVLPRRPARRILFAARPRGRDDDAY